MRLNDKEFLFSVGTIWVREEKHAREILKFCDNNHVEYQSYDLLAGKQLEQKSCLIYSLQSWADRAATDEEIARLDRPNNESTTDFRQIVMSMLRQVDTNTLKLELEKRGYRVEFASREN